MEKIRLIETLSDDGSGKQIFTILDAFVGKKKTKGHPSSVLEDVVRCVFISGKISSLPEVAEWLIATD